LRVIQLRFGITFHVCDDGWSVSYGGKSGNAAGDIRHDRRGTTRSSMVTCEDHGELEHVNCDKCDELR